MRTLLSFQLRPIELSDEPSSDDLDIDNEEENTEDDPFEIVARREERIGRPLFFTTKEEY